MLKYLLRNEIAPITELKDDKLKEYELRKKTNTLNHIYSVYLTLNITQYVKLACTFPSGHLLSCQIFPNPLS